MSVDAWLGSTGLGSFRQYFIPSAALRSQWGPFDELSHLASLAQRIESLHALLDALLPEGKADAKRELAAAITRLQPGIPRSPPPSRANSSDSSAAGRPEEASEKPEDAVLPHPAAVSTAQDVLRRSRVALQLQRPRDRGVAARQPPRGQPAPEADLYGGQLARAWEAAGSSGGGREASGARRRVSPANAAPGEQWQDVRADGGHPHEGVNGWAGRWRTSSINGVVGNSTGMTPAAPLPAERASPPPASSEADGLWPEPYSPRGYASRRRGSPLRGHSEVSARRLLSRAC